MAFSWKNINPALGEHALCLIINMADKHGINVVPYFGLRSLEEQAKLWRQSRPTAVINAKIEELIDKGAPYLASIIRKVGPSNGFHVTNAIPGFSWHNWGEGIDFYVEENGSAVWDGKDHRYEILAVEAVELGLTSGYYFKTIFDPGHIQLRKQEVAAVYSVKEVNDKFKGEKI
jgi:hypothetical protein